MSTNSPSLTATHGNLKYTYSDSGEGDHSYSPHASPEMMFSPADKENVAPHLPSAATSQSHELDTPKKSARKGRSKSIGPGGLDESASTSHDAKVMKENAKNRRKSTYVPATKAIISAETEKAQRQAARRKTLANRRVSFAPEATLHTWDVIEFMRDPTTSTQSPGSTRRGSHIASGSPTKRDSPLDSVLPSNSSDEDDDLSNELTSPAHKRDRNQIASRRSSGIPPMNFNNPDDFSSSGVSGSSDVSESEEGDEDAEGDSEDDTGTAMSIDVENNTAQSMVESVASTDSSVRLEAALRQAANAAGTRGIEYDEYGEDVSMEIAGDEITNAFKPWAEGRDLPPSFDSSLADQENVNPFLPAYKAHSEPGAVVRALSVVEEETGDISMDVTRAVGAIVEDSQPQPASSPLGDGTMDLTQAVGKIHHLQQAPFNSVRAAPKRRRSTTETGSPGGEAMQDIAKRRRSSVARSSVGDESMDLTLAIGGITDGIPSPTKIPARTSSTRRRSSGVTSERDDATMDITRAFGAVKASSANEKTVSSVDENEELTMELTTVVGGLNTVTSRNHDSRPETPNSSDSPAQIAANTTPTDQRRFRSTPEGGPVKLLTPVFEQQIGSSTTVATSQSQSPGEKLSTSQGPNGVMKSPNPAGSPLDSKGVMDEETTRTQGQTPTPSKTSLSPLKHSTRRDNSFSPTIKSTYAAQDKMVAHQSFAADHNPWSPKQHHTTSPSTPKQGREEPSQRLADSIKLMSTPRKETLRSMTPKKQLMPAALGTPSKTASPVKVPSSRSRRTLQVNHHSTQVASDSLNDESVTLETSVQPVEKIRLQDFLDLAGIHFMDLTTTKRRVTAAPTPSKTRQTSENQIEQAVDFESAVIAGSCTIPELEMYEHACHELKRYISDGKKVVKELEAQTANENPPFLRSYISGNHQRQTVMDAQMRDVKSNARLQSKEIWYAWRSQLLDDLTKGLQSIGEGLINDAEALQLSEEKVDQVLPGLISSHGKLQMELEMVEQENAAMNQDDNEELDPARESLQLVNQQIAERQAIVARLRKEAGDLDASTGHLHEMRAEFTAAIKEADHVKEACRGISINEIEALTDSVHSFELSRGWTITSASSSPATLTMTYLSELELFFHPTAFRTSSDSGARPNEPISLSYLPQKQPSTTTRFFLQLLRASLHAIPQSQTRLAGLLTFLGQGWDTALALAESERRLSLESPTDSRIVSDEELCISSAILVSEMRTKVRLFFNVTARLGGDAQDGLKLVTSIVPNVEVAYGEKLNERAMKDCLGTVGQDACEGWDTCTKELRERLVAGAFSSKGSGMRRK